MNTKAIQNKTIMTITIGFNLNKGERPGRVLPSRMNNKGKPITLRTRITELAPNETPKITNANIRTVQNKLSGQTNLMKF